MYQMNHPSMNPILNKNVFKFLVEKEGTQKTGYMLYLGDEALANVLSFLPFSTVFDVSFFFRETVGARFLETTNQFKCITWMVKKGPRALQWIESKGVVSPSPFTLYNLAVIYNKECVLDWLYNQSILSTVDFHALAVPSTPKIYLWFEKKYTIPIRLQKDWVKYWIASHNIPMLDLCRQRHLLTYNHIVHVTHTDVLAWWDSAYKKIPFNTFHLRRLSLYGLLPALQWLKRKGIPAHMVSEMKQYVSLYEVCDSIRLFWSSFYKGREEDREELSE